LREEAKAVPSIEASTLRSSSTATEDGEWGAPQAKRSLYALGRLFPGSPPPAFDVLNVSVGEGLKPLLFEIIF